MYYLSKKDEWKVQVTNTNVLYDTKAHTFRPAPIHSKSDWINFRQGSNMRKKYNEIIETQKQRFENNLEKAMRPSNISFVNLDHIHIEFKKLTLSSGAALIDLPDWITVKRGSR